MPGTLIGMADFDRGGVKLMSVCVAGGLLSARKGAEVFQRNWKENILDTLVQRTGRYYRSIDIMEFQEPGEAAILVYTDAVNPRDGAPYPVYLEYGTRNMRPHPTARPAFERGKDEAAEAAGRELGQLIAEAFA